MARIYVERRDLGEDFRRWLGWLDLESPESSGAPGEFLPPMDVLETASSVEVLIDVPGVAADTLKIVLMQGALVVGGTKLPGQCPHRQAAFHLAERSFGRFVRVVRVTGAVDGGHAVATLRTGELHIVLPRIEERRGREIPIPLRMEQ